MSRKHWLANLVRYYEGNLLWSGKVIRIIWLRISTNISTNRTGEMPAPFFAFSTNRHGARSSNRRWRRYSLADVFELLTVSLLRRCYRKSADMRCINTNSATANYERTEITIAFDLTAFLKEPELQNKVKKPTKW